MKYNDLLRKEEILSCVDLGWVVGCDDLWWRRQQLPEVDGPSKSFLLPQHLSVHVLFFPAQKPLLILTSLDLYKHTLEFLQINGNGDKYILRFGKTTFSYLNKSILRFWKYFLRFVPKRLRFVPKHFEIISPCLVLPRGAKSINPHYPGFLRQRSKLNTQI